MTTPDIGKSLQLRKRIKAKKPSFIRQDSFRFPKLKNKNHWRRPQGRHSKIRAKKKGQATLVRWGYGSPAYVRGLFSEGQVPIIIYRPEDLAQLNSQKHIAIIGASVGIKKRVMIVALAQKKGMKLFNVQVKAYQENVDKELEERRKIRKMLLARRERKQKEEKAQEKKRMVQEREEKEKAVEKETASEKAIEALGSGASGAPKSEPLNEKLQKRLEAEKVIIHK